MLHRIMVNLDGIAHSPKHGAQIDALLDVMSKSALDRADLELVCTLQDAVGRMTDFNLRTFYSRLDTVARERFIWVVSLVCGPSTLSFIVRSTVTTEEIDRAARSQVADKLAMLDARLDAIIAREVALQARETNLQRSLAAAQADLYRLSKQLGSLADNL